MLRRILLLSLAIPLAATLAAQFTTSPEQLKEHVSILASDSLLGRGFGTPQGLQAAVYIAEQFAKAGIESLDGNYLHPFNHRDGILNIAGNNVVGVIRGTHPDLKDEYIVLGAHYDHLGWKLSKGDTIVYNGADDNASGTASLIEIGRNLVERKAELGRTVILVAFDGEESGLIGSNYFLKDSSIETREIKAMFSLDMIGMTEAHKGLDMKGVSQLDDADYLVGELAEKYGLNITRINARVEQRTDTAPFGNLGIPAIAPNTGTESPYHKPGDTAEKLDYTGMAQVTNYMSEATLYLASRETLADTHLKDQKEFPGSRSKVFEPGIRLNVGSGYHNYKDQFYEGKNIFTGSTGVFAKISITPNLKLQPEVLYETKGSRHTDGKFRTHSLTGPVNLQFLTTENESVRVFFQAGAYYSYHFGGKISGTPIDFDKGYHRHELGISYGAGLEVMKMVQMGIYFQKGLSDLNRQAANRMMHQNIYFQLGFIF